MNKAYKKAGVDLEAGYRSVKLIEKFVKDTYRDGVLSDIGGFGGLFSLSAIKDMEHPVMVSGTDSVGTKIQLAFLTDRHDTVGIDCVAMSVNDIVCCGAEPLFFLDYIGCGKNYPEKMAQIVKGVAEGCKMAGAALIGGEMAEMPGSYPEDEYDLVGFAAGVVDKKNIIDGSGIEKGDVLLGLASSGLHSNGFSLVRSVLRLSKNNIGEYVESLGTTLGEALLSPTRIYVKPVLSLIKQVRVKGISNITGGGFYENIPRMLKSGSGLAAEIDAKSFEVPPVFNLIKSTGGISDKEMYNTFNMGVGMVLCVAPEDAGRARRILEENGERVYQIGKIVEADSNHMNGINLCLE